MLAAMETVPATATPRPLIVTADEVLLDELLRLCAAAAVSPEVVPEAERARRAWSQAPCVLVGADSADAVATLELERRRGVVLVAVGPERSNIWRAGVAVRADHVVVIPDGESWLVERLADSAEENATAAVTIGVTGARGGAGASTLAAALGLCASRRGQATVLVDVDPRAGGVELVVGCEQSPGLRWSEAARTRGRVGADALRGALPSLDGLAVLSWQRTDDGALDPATLRAIVSSARRGADVVVLDIGRHFDDVTVQAMTSVDVLLVVCTPDVRSAAGAAKLLGAVRPLVRDTRLVCRHRRGARLDAEYLAETLDLPLAGVLATRRTTEHAVDDGLGPLLRGAMTRECTQILRRIGADAAGAPR